MPDGDANGRLKSTAEPADLEYVAICPNFQVRPGEDTGAILETLVRHFDRDISGNRRLIRELFDRDRQTFYSRCIAILKRDAGSRGSQYLISLLAANDLLLPALCDPALTRQQARAERAEALVELQKKVAELLGTPLPQHGEKP